MRYAQIQHLGEHYGTIAHADIWAKVDKHNLDGLIVTVDPRPGTEDPEALKPTTREVVIGKGLMYGISRTPNGLTAASYAARLNADLNALGIDGKRHPRTDPCYILANAEDHAFNLLAFLDAWRGDLCKRPTRATGWAIEGMQGGRLGPFVDRCNTDANLDVIAEAYTGPVRQPDGSTRPDMYPVAADAVKANLAAAGLKRTRIAYDGKLGAPDYMDGIVYTLERLPL